MLVLSRKTQQCIRLGDAIVVTVIGVGGDRVRLGIEAPSDVRILREELKRDQTPLLEIPCGLGAVSSASAG